MLLGAPVQPSKEQSDEVSRLMPPWWTNPFLYCLFFLLPFFLVTVWLAGPYMILLGQKVDNMTFDNVLLGLGSIAMFMLGASPFCFRQEPCRTAELSMPSVNRALKFMGTLSLVCNLIYFAPLAFHPALIVSFLSGGASAMYEVRDTLGQIPGITSFISACLPFFALYSAMIINKNKKEISRYNRRLFGILFAFIALRAIAGSERLALIEACVAYGIPRAVFVWEKSRFRTTMPFIGVVGVFSFFCIGEFFRSWQYYQKYYASFWEFITVRFFGYFATSINNGAGVITHYAPLDMPGQTIDGFYALLRIVGIDYVPGRKLLQNYLLTYSTPEFNSPGGLYVPYMDYGVILGLFVFVIMGVLTGLLYVKFLKKKPIGLLLYPPWFLGLLDIIRGWIWGNSRFVPVLIVSVFSLTILHIKRTDTNKA